MPQFEQEQGRKKRFHPLVRTYTERQKNYEKEIQVQWARLHGMNTIKLHHHMVHHKVITTTQSQTTGMPEGEAPFRGGQRVAGVYA